MKVVVVPAEIIHSGSNRKQKVNRSMNRNKKDEGMAISGR